MAYYRQFLAFLFLSVLAFNSCIDDNFTDIDTSITYDTDASLPLGNVSLLMESFMDTIILVPIPDDDTTLFFLYDSVYYYSPGKIKLSTSGYFSLAPFENDTVKITSLMFRTNAVNGIPAEIDHQLYFADTSNTIIDSLYSTGPMRIEPAPTDDEGNVTGTYEIWKVENDLSPAMIDKISETQYIFLSAELIIPDSQHDTIPFYSSQDIWIQIGIRVGLKIDF